jgi:hypothetical protein
MNMKAIKNFEQPFSFNVNAVTSDNDTPLTMAGASISPRGLTTHCTGEQIAILHNIEDNGSQSKYQLLMVELQLNFKDGELIRLESPAQIVCIRRVSQTEFEVNMEICNMAQDSLRHITRYVCESSVTATK